MYICRKGPSPTILPSLGLVAMCPRQPLPPAAMDDLDASDPHLPLPPGTPAPAGLNIHPLALLYNPGHFTTNNTATTTTTTATTASTTTTDTTTNTASTNTTTSDTSTSDTTYNNNNNNNMTELVESSSYLWL